MCSEYCEMLILASLKLAYCYRDSSETNQKQKDWYFLYMAKNYIQHKYI